jgi:hypothetical protein
MLKRTASQILFDVHRIEPTAIADQRKRKCARAAQTIYCPGRDTEEKGEFFFGQECGHGSPRIFFIL